MIKNKALHIKVIFKTYSKHRKQVKIISSPQTDFCSTKYQRTIFKICSQKLFPKTLHTSPTKPKHNNNHSQSLTLMGVKGP